MGFTKRKLKGLLAISDMRNEAGLYSELDVIGVSTEKDLIPTKANLNGVNLKTYKVLEPGNFAFVADTSRRGDKMALAYNDTTRTYIVSTWYVVFKIKDEAVDTLLPEYLYMFFNRPEFDRYTRTNSWGSAREYFWFADMEDIELELPPIDIQRKYVAIYKSMLANQRSYEQGLNDLKSSCDALIERLMREVPCEPIGAYIEQSDERNSCGLGKDAVRGLSIDKQLIQTKAKLDGVSLSSYKVVKPGYLVYVPVTSRNGGKISVALNETGETYIVSAINTVFRIREEARNRLLPAYLMLFFGRAEFDRYARFCSWGSARETFSWEEMRNVRIPLPDIVMQRCAVNLYQAWQMRSAINERLKCQLKDICPVLIRGSIEEASR